MSHNRNYRDRRHRNDQNYRDRRYRDDRVFDSISSQYLTLQREDTFGYNIHLKNVIENIFISKMKEDHLFRALYRRLLYGGSYYKGTKYGKPDEFDLDAIMELPITKDRIKIDTDHDNYGYVKIKLDTQGKISSDWEKHSQELNSWLTHDNYLDQNKFRSWMEGVIASAFNKLEKSRDGHVMRYDGKIYSVKHKKSGPAFTVKITSQITVITPRGCEIDVDLVPCLEFVNVSLRNGYRLLSGRKYNPLWVPRNSGPRWNNIYGYRQQQSESASLWFGSFNKKRTWMAIPKPLKEKENPEGNILWRLSFYEQEKQLLRGESGKLKPVIRMMKKLRDTREWKGIASYYIETIFYHELEKHFRNRDLLEYLNAPKTWLFVNGLKNLRRALFLRELHYFWHPGHNLFSKIREEELLRYHNELDRLIKEIQEEIEDDGHVLARVVLTPEEAEEIEMDD